MNSKNDPLYQPINYLPVSTMDSKRVDVQYRDKLYDGSEDVGEERGMKMVNNIFKNIMAWPDREEILNPKIGDTRARSGWLEDGTKEEWTEEWDGRKWVTTFSTGGIQ